MFSASVMRPDDDSLTRLALLALENAMDEARSRPVRRSYGMRLALAYLFSRQDCERWPFDLFWRFLPSEEEKGRVANLSAALNGIYLQIGVRKMVDRPKG